MTYSIIINRKCDHLRRGNFKSANRNVKYCQHSSIEVTHYWYFPLPVMIGFFLSSIWTKAQESLQQNEQASHPNTLLFSNTLCHISCPQTPKMFVNTSLAHSLPAILAKVVISCCMNWWTWILIWTRWEGRECRSYGLWWRVLVIYLQHEKKNPQTE